MTGRQMSLGLMKAFSILTKNRIITPGEASGMMKKYQGMTILTVEDVLNDLAEIDVPEDKLGTFGYVCRQLAEATA